MESTLESGVMLITWEKIKEEISSWPRDKKYFGVPRGGAYISALLNPVDTPEQADIIVDDVIGSGRTLEHYKERYPDKPFMAPFDKRVSRLPYLLFPWETTAKADISDHVARIIERFDNINREGLKETPERYVRFLEEFLSAKEFKFSTFDNEGGEELILVKDIPFYSLCEHHLAPFFGVAHIGYIPNKVIAGLSKLPRTLDKFARRFQNQERITFQVMQELQEQLNPKGVGVVLQAEHLCMSMRGIQKPGTKTVTQAFLGQIDRTLFFEALK